VSGYCENDNDLQGSIKLAEFNSKLGNYYMIKKDSAS
jgi:hypothetical protein